MSSVVVRLGFLRTSAHGNDAGQVFTPITDCEVLTSAAGSTARCSGATVVTDAHVAVTNGLVRLVFRVANCGGDHIRFGKGDGTLNVHTGNAWSGLPANSWDYVGVEAVGDRIAVANL